MLQSIYILLLTTIPFLVQQNVGLVPLSSFFPDRDAAAASFVGTWHVVKIPASRSQPDILLY